MTTTRTRIAKAAIIMLGLAAGHADAKSAAFPHLNPLLKAWLQKDLGAPDAAREKAAPTRAVSAAVALSTAKTEVFVHVTGDKGQNATGSGPAGKGTLLILEFNGQVFTQVDKLAASAPVRVIDGAYGEHPDLIVMAPLPQRLHYADKHYTPVAGKPNPSAGRLMIAPGDAGEPVYR